jgi:hypothetical protein
VLYWELGKESKTKKGGLLDCTIYGFYKALYIFFTIFGVSFAPLATSKA